MKSAFLKASIVLVPSYTVAFFTDKMVYVVPTLVAAGFFASSLDLSNRNTSSRVDEEADDGTDGEISLNDIDSGLT